MQLQPVSIHGIACLLQRSGGYVVNLHTGTRIAAAPTRLLAVARAALALQPAQRHNPVSAATQQGA